MIRIAPLVVIASLLLTTGVGTAVEVGGHVKAQLVFEDYRVNEIGSLLAGEQTDLETLDARCNVAWRRGAWDVSAQTQFDWLRGELVGASGDPHLASVQSALLPVPDVSDRDQVLDLSWTLSDGDMHLLFGRLDRLSIGYTRGPLAVRAGRQASSWGGGLVFQVLDLFNPFPPNALDTEYKPGVDMLSAQWLFTNGDDLQAIVVPRRASRRAPLAASRSSSAVKWRHFARSLTLELLAAHHYGDDIAGLGVSGNLAGGVWRCDVATTFREDGEVIFSGLVNLNRTWTWTGKNVAGYVELFRNGFGVTSVDDGFEALPHSLLTRLDRGELFSVGRNEVAAGLRVEWTPLTIVEPTMLMNLNDASTYLLAQIHHDWRQNLELALGGQVPLGGRDTEYGGIRVASLDTYLAPGRTAWARVSFYY